jgi:hypothetical protein
MFTKCLAGDVRGQVQRKPINTGSQRWQGHIGDLQVLSDLADGHICLSQHLSLVSRAVQISWRNSVDHILGWKIEGSGEGGLSDL